MASTSAAITTPAVSRPSLWRKSRRSLKKTTEVAQPKAETVKRGGNKLSYNLQRELEQLPQKLEALEAELQTLQDQVADPDFFGQPHDRTQQVLAQLAEAEQALEAAFERWEYLEGLKNGA